MSPFVLDIKYQGLASSAFLGSKSTQIRTRMYVGTIAVLNTCSAQSQCRTAGIAQLLRSSCRQAGKLSTTYWTTLQHRWTAVFLGPDGLQLGWTIKPMVLELLCFFSETKPYFIFLFYEEDKALLLREHMVFGHFRTGCHSY